MGITVAPVAAKASSSILGPIMGGLGALLGFSGQRSANKKNIQLAREQMAFQERMSNSAYQRSMADMRKAGLNPILAAKQPASSPGGQTAKVDSALGAGISSFNQTASALAQQANLTANTRATSAKAVKDEFMNQNIFDKDLPPEQQKINAALAQYGLTPALISLATSYLNENKTQDLKVLLTDSMRGMGDTIQATSDQVDKIILGLRNMYDDLVKRGGYKYNETENYKRN